MSKVKLLWDTPYRSGPLASTDLHAGGIFFCTPYYESIIFAENGTVTITRRVIENFRPLDGQTEIDRYNSYQLVGRHEISSRGYLKCTFEGLELTGLPLVDHPEVLTFHAFRPGSGHQFSQAYSLVLV